MNEVEHRRVKATVDETVDTLVRSLETLLENQIGAMNMHDNGKRKMARERLLAAYVDVAKSLHAHELEKTDEELTCMQDATQKISGMQAEL
jgi:hypothetical protein